MARARIVHVSLTRLAGMPIRLVRALQAHTGYEARLIDYSRWGQFEHDVVFSEQRDEAISLLEDADIIHLHNYLDYQSDAFAPIDFADLRARGKIFVRQFHSAPVTVVRRMGFDMDRVHNSGIPSLVVGQVWERLYPEARVVPNFLPQDDPLYTPSGAPGDGIVFSPGAQDDAWSRRWGQKGARETAAVLERVARRTGCPIETIDDGRPLDAVLAAKRDRLIAIDELVTGSYHLNGLEALCLGRAAVCFLDERCQLVLRTLSGSEVDPFVNVRLEDAEDVLTYLVRHPDEAAELGREGRHWIENHWSDRDLVGHFVEVYDALAEGRAIARQPELALDGASARFQGIVLPDLVWNQRRRQALAARPRSDRLRERAREAYQRIPYPVRKRLRLLLRRHVFDDHAVAVAERDRRLYEDEIRALGTDRIGA